MNNLKIKLIALKLLISLIFYEGILTVVTKTTTLFKTPIRNGGNIVNNEIE